MKKYLLATILFLVCATPCFANADTIKIAATQDVSLSQETPDTNYNHIDYLFVMGRDGIDWRSIINFTLPFKDGEISDVKLFLYETGGYQNNNVEIHQLTQTNWLEQEATWNKYNNANYWNSAGGDYGDTIIDSVISGEDYIGWTVWVLQGDGADNPLTLRWGDEINLLLKKEASYGWNSAFYSREEAGEHSPYLEITFLPPPPPPPPPPFSIASIPTTTPADILNVTTETLGDIWQYLVLIIGIPFAFYVIGRVKGFF